MKYCLFFLAFILTNSIFCQPRIELQKSFGGSESENSGGVIMNRNGGFTIAGSSNSTNGQVTGLHPGVCSFGVCQDFWIVKTDSLGNLLWQSCFGGTEDDAAYSIAPTRDGGSISCGYTGSSDGDVTGNHVIPGIPEWDAWVVKLDSLGNLLWKRCYGGSKGEFAFSIIPTFDSSFVMAGYAYSTDGDVPGNHRPNPPPGGQTTDAWVVKLDSVGNIQWSKNYGSMGDEVVHSIIQTFDSGYAFLAVTNSIGGDVTCNHGYKDYWLVRLDRNGNILWNNCFGGSDEDQGYSLKQTLDSGFILVGMAGSVDGDVSFRHDSIYADIWIVKTDQFGILEWEKSLGGTNYDVGTSVVLLTDSTYLVGASVLSTDRDVSGNHGSADFYLAKINQTGQLEWSKCYGGGGADWNSGLIDAGPQSWMMVGYTDSNSGDVSGNHGSEDYWAVKLTDIPVSVSDIYFNEDFGIFPNPFRNSITLKFPASLKGKIIVMNTLGDILFENAVKESQVIDLSILSDGIYFIKYNDKHRNLIKKIIKMN